MLPLTLSLFDRNDLQYRYHADGRSLRVIKTLFGGEDKSLFVRLPKSLGVDHPEVGYGNKIELRLGTTRVFLGEQREIEQFKREDKEGLSIASPGYSVFLEEDGYGGKGKLWCDTRYGKLNPVTSSLWSQAEPQRNQMDTQDRLYLAPRQGEGLGSPTWYNGSLYYLCPYDNVERITAAYDLVLSGLWRFDVVSGNDDFTGLASVWNRQGVTQAANLDIDLSGAPKPLIIFRIYYNGPETIFDGSITSCKKYDAPVYTDYTVEAQAGDTVALNALGGAGDYLYIGSDRTFFSTIKFNIGAIENVNASVMTAQYWNGAWVALTITDGTADAGRTLFKTGDVTFDRPSDWAQVAVDGVTCWWVRLLFSNALSDPTAVRQIKTHVNTGDVYALITDLKIFGSLDTTPTSTDVAKDIVSQVESGTPISDSEVLIETINLTLLPLVFEREETCYEALEIVTFYGDAQHKLLSFGVESGGDRVFVRTLDYSSVRYVVHASDARRILRRGTTRGDYLTEGWGKYRDEEGQIRYTVKYYAHVTPAGIVANTTSSGDDLASAVFGVKKSRPIDFGPMSPATAADAIQQYLIEHAHPLITSSIEIFYSVKDMHRGGMVIHPLEMELGYLVQIPWFRAVEVEGAGGDDIREWSTTFLLVGYEYDHDRGSTRLFPEGTEESLARTLAYIMEMEV